MKKILKINVILLCVLTFILCGCSSESEDDNSFADISERYFIYSSGAGGWRTELTISADGKFEGAYSDSDMGSVGDDYPNGTIYYCNFNGKFTSRTKISDYEYSMKCESLVYEDDVDKEEIIEGIRYIATDAFGLENADEFRLYLPGMKVADLPQGFIDTAWMLINEGDETISFYGLYNIATDTGFVTWE